MGNPSQDADSKCLQVYSELFSDGTPERMDQLFRYLDKDNTGCIDYLSWSRRIRLQVGFFTRTPLDPCWLHNHSFIVVLKHKFQD